MIKVSVPATSANLGPGFDTLGVALEIRNVIEMEETGILDIVIEAGGHEVLEDPEQNLTYQSALRLFERAGYRPHGLYIRQQDQIPIARGTGSSSAAVVGGLVAANALVGRMTGRVPFTQAELLRLAVEIEGHPDNVTPALVGGFTVSCMNEGEPLFVRFDPPPELKAVIVMPEVPFTAKKTQKSRGVLPEAVTLKDAVYNLNRAALLVAALAQGRIDLMGVAMEDRLHQPYRASLYAGMASVLQAGMAAGAKGVALSGAGPAVLAFVVGDESAVVYAMEAAFNWAGSEARSLVVPLAREGARIEG